MSINSDPGNDYIEILEMPKWKSRVLNIVAWILGMRGENVYCITLNVNLDEIKEENEKKTNKIMKDLMEENV